MQKKRAGILKTVSDQVNNLLTCDDVEASFVKGAHEQLEPDDGVDDDDEEDEEGDVHQGDDRHQDGIHHNLQT